VKRQRPKKVGPPMVLGVAWYREADWPRIKELFPDAADLHDTYAEWLKDAEASVKRLTRPGATVEPVMVNIDDFLGWCMVHGLNMSLGRSTVNIQAKGKNRYPPPPNIC
jgi:hypothetical protein